jgi:hypothetical protein
VTGHVHKDEDPPWARPGAVRRDREPHRSALLLALGQASVVCGLTSLCCLFPAVPGLPLGLCVWVLARRDMRMMRAGLMDPDGEMQTMSARDASLVGLALNLVGGALLCREVWQFFAA